MVKDDLKKFLAEVPIFSDLTEDESDVLMEKLEEISLPAGRTIFHEGDEGDSLYIIRSGKVRISKIFRRGEEKSLAILGAKSIFGEMALLEEGKRSASATAVDDIRLLELTRGDLEELAEENSSAGYNIMAGIARVLSSRLRKMNEEFLSIFSHPFRSIKELEIILENVENNFVTIGWEKI